MTARINRQTAVSGLINEYHRACTASKLIAWRLTWGS
jgi:hypothetical protein